MVPDIQSINYQNQKLEISKISFYKSIQLPVTISERLFNSFSESKDTSYITYKQLKSGLNDLYFGTFEDTAKAIFKLYDFDFDGFINKVDVNILFAFLPLKDQTGDYKCQLEALEELDEILESTFNFNDVSEEKKNSEILKEDELNFENFLIAIQRRSDILLQMLCFLYQTYPFQEKILVRASEESQKSQINNVHNHEELNLAEDEDIFYVFLSNKAKSSITLVPPKFSSKFAPAAKFLAKYKDFYKNHDGKIKCSNDVLEIKYNNNFNGNNIIISQDKCQRAVSKKDYEAAQESKVSAILSNNSLDNLDNNQKILKNSEKLQVHQGISSVDNLESNNQIDTIVNNNYLTELLSTKDDENSHSSDSLPSLNAFGFIKKDSSEQSSKVQHKPNTSDTEASYEGSVISYNSSSQIRKQIWLVSLDHCIYMYTDSTKKEQIGFNYIKGCFIKQKGSINIRSVNYYEFSIVFSNKTQSYLTLRIDDALKWATHLRSVIGYRIFLNTTF